MSADVRTGLAGSTEEAMQGDAAAAFVVGSDADGPIVAELIGSASVTDEYIERWRTPGELRTKVWDERFSEIAGVPLAVAAWNAALESAGITANDVALAAVAAPVQRVAAGHGREARRGAGHRRPLVDRRHRRCRAARDAARRVARSRRSPVRSSRS